MKTLKNLLYVTYIFFILFPFILGSLIILVWINMPEEINVIYKDFPNTRSILIALLQIVSYVTFIIILKYMIRVVTDFINQQYFSTINLKLISRIGYCLILIFVLSDILIPCLKATHKLVINLDVIDILTSATYKLYFGLFLIGIGKAFKLGLQQKEENIELKQENELTI